MANLIDDRFTEDELNEFVDNHSLDDEQLAEKLGIDEGDIDNDDTLNMIREKGYRFWAKNTLTENHSGWVDTNKLNDREKEIFEYIETLA